MTWKTLNSDVVLVIETFEFRICFEFLISNFGFPNRQKIKNLKASLIPACPGWAYDAKKYRGIRFHQKNQPGLFDPTGQHYQGHWR